MARRMKDAQKVEDYDQPEIWDN
jgi:hypothetical protein